MVSTPYGDVDEVVSLNPVPAFGVLILSLIHHPPSIVTVSECEASRVSTTVQAIEFLLYDKFEPRTSILRLLQVQDSVFHLHGSPATLGRSSSGIRHAVTGSRE
jgi:hypothetical protein